MRKDGKDRGLLQLRGHWYVRLSYEGQPRQFGPFKNKTDAGRFYARSKEEIELKRFFPAQYQTRRQDQTTFREYAQRWFSERPMKRLKYSTMISYKYALEKWILPYFGARRIVTIRREHIRQYATWLQDQQVKLARANNLMKCLAVILADAMEEEVIDDSPARHIGKIIKPPLRSDKRILTPEEEERFLAMCQGAHPGWYALWLTFMKTGMRIGEVKGLHLDDVDFERMGIFVRRGVWSGRVQETPKSGRVRFVDMPKPLAVELAKHIEDLRLEAKVRGLEAPVILFPAERGMDRYLLDWRVRKVFTELLRLTGLPSLTPHILRHTYASRLLAKGLPMQYVSAQLGHSTIGVTVGVYGHLLPVDRKRWIDSLND